MGDNYTGHVEVHQNSAKASLTQPTCMVKFCEVSKTTFYWRKQNFCFGIISCLPLSCDKLFKHNNGENNLDKINIPIYDEQGQTITKLQLNGN